MQVLVRDYILSQMTERFEGMLDILFQDQTIGPKAVQIIRLVLDTIGQKKVPTNLLKGSDNMGITIPRAGRPDGYDDTNKVGPGAYNISRDIVTRERGTFGKSRRVLNGEEVEIDPDLAKIGPGAYTIEDDTFQKGNGKGITILGKPRAQSAQPGSKLGPGQYYRDTGKLANEAYSFGKDIRKGLTYNENNRVGPGQYGTLRNKRFGKNGISFARSKRTDLKTDSGLGPGYYSSQRVKKVQPEVAVGTFGTAERKIGERLNDKGSASHIGPGYYTRKEKRNSGWTFGKDGREGLGVNANNLGPGAYNIKNELGKKLGIMGRSSRDPKDKINKTPGFYKIPATVPDVPKYLLPAENKRKIHL